METSPIPAPHAAKSEAVASRVAQSIGPPRTETSRPPRVEPPTSVPAPTPDGPCQLCGARGSTKLVTFRQNIGLIVLRFHKKVEGHLCSSCRQKTFQEMTFITFLGGWWGVISFFVTPVVLVQNVVSYLGARDGEPSPALHGEAAKTEARAADPLLAAMSIAVGVVSFLLGRWMYVGAALALALGIAALWRSRGAAQPEGVRLLAVLGIGCGAIPMILGAVLIIAWVLGPAARPSSEASRGSDFDSANQSLFAYHGQEAFGNTSEAKQLAARFSNSMALMVRIGFTGGRKDEAGTLTQGHFLTHCELREKQICFLVHVPELRNFGPDARKELLKLAWITAKGVTGETRGGQEVRMAVGLRGVLLYGAAAVGMSSGDPTMDLDTIDTDKFSPFFTGGAWISSPTPPPLAASSTIAAVLPKAEASPLPAVSPRVLPASEPSSVPPAAVAPLPPSAPAAPPGPIGERAKKFARLALAGDEGAALRLLREFRSLGRDARPALPAIAKIGRDFHVASEVQSQALAALGDIGGPEAAGLLADAMGDRSPSVQALASQALGRLRGDDVRGVMPRLAADLERRCPIATNAKPVEMGFCYSGLSAIRAIGPDAEGATASLIRLVRAGDWSSNMKHHAIRAIGAIGPRARDAVPALIELLGAGPEEGAEALRSLGAIGPPAVDALPALRRLLAATDKKGPEESVEQLAFRKALITSTIAQIQSGG